MDSDVPCLYQEVPHKPSPPSIESRLYSFFSNFWNKIACFFALISLVFIVHYMFWCWQHPSSKAQRRIDRLMETFFAADERLDG